MNEKFEKIRTKQQPAVDPMNFAAKFLQHPSNKAKFIRWVVYTANVALMVGSKSSHLNSTVATLHSDLTSVL